MENVSGMNRKTEYLSNDEQPLIVAIQTDSGVLIHEMQKINIYTANSWKTGDTRNRKCRFTKKDPKKVIFIAR